MTPTWQEYLPVAFQGQGDIAELAPGSRPGFLLWNAPLPQVVRPLRDVRFDFRGEVVRVAAPLPHDDSRGHMTLAMPANIRSKAETSCASWRFPAAVRR